MKIMFLVIIQILSTVDSRCYNTYRWRDKLGNNCRYYKDMGICSKYTKSFTSYKPYISGNEFQFPELNCCNCGKSDVPFYQKPSKTPNSCTHLEVNSKSQHIVEYCKKVHSQVDCNSQYPGYRTIHCKWNAKQTQVTLAGVNWI